MTLASLMAACEGRLQYVRESLTPNKYGGDHCIGEHAAEGETRADGDDSGPLSAWRAAWHTAGGRRAARGRGGE